MFNILLKCYSYFQDWRMWKGISDLHFIFKTLVSHKFLNANFTYMISLLKLKNRGQRGRDKLEIHKESKMLNLKSNNTLGTKKKESSLGSLPVAWLHNC